jgi:hypothetical protein
MRQGTSNQGKIPEPAPMSTAALIIGHLVAEPRSVTHNVRIPRAERTLWSGFSGMTAGEGPTNTVEGRIRPDQISLARSW